MTRVGTGQIPRRRGESGFSCVSGAELFYRDPVLSVLLLLCPNPLDLGSVCAPALLKDQTKRLQVVKKSTSPNVVNSQTKMQGFGQFPELTGSVSQ